jgi:hypothetical protein
MSSRTYEGMVPALADVEALVLAAMARLWKHLDRMLPLWFALAAFHALTHAVARSQAVDTPILQQILANEASTMTNLAVSALASGIALRIFLGRGREALRPTGDLGGYVSIVVLLAVAPAVVMMGLHPPAFGMPRAQLIADAPRFGLALATCIATFGVALRLTLWPIARLLDDRRVTASQSWALMRGAVGRYAGAVLLLVAPLALVNGLIAGLVAHAPALANEAATAPLRALMTLAAAAVAGEVYRKRMAL